MLRQSLTAHAVLCGQGARVALCHCRVLLRTRTMAHSLCGLAATKEVEPHARLPAHIAAAGGTVVHSDPSLIGSVLLGDGGTPERCRRPPPPLAVFPEVVSEEEETLLAREAQKWLRRRQYETGHFDRVIVGYREVQKSMNAFSAASRDVLERLVASAFAPTPPPLLPVHLLDLQPDGYILKHVDHLEYSGGSIVGLSLLSDAVMTLHHQPSSEEGAAPTTTPNTRTAVTGAWLPMRLPRRSLYVLRGEARYEWAHAVPLTAEAWEAGLPPKQRRLTILFRDAPPDEPWAADCER